MKRNLLWFLLALTVAPLHASDHTTDNPSGDNNAAVARSPEEARDGKAWGIHNGCIGRMRIKRVDFTSNDAGIIELVNGQKVRVTLRNGCSGIRNEGYVHKPVNGKFCEGDILRVIHYGNACIVDSIKPYVVTNDS